MTLCKGKAHYTSDLLFSLLAWQINGIKMLFLTPKRSESREYFFHHEEEERFRRVELHFARLDKLLQMRRGTARSSRYGYHIESKINVGKFVAD